MAKTSRQIQQKARLKITSPKTTTLLTFDGDYGSLTGGLAETATKVTERKVEGNYCLKIERSSTSPTSNYYFEYSKDLPSVMDLYDYAKPDSSGFPTKGSIGIYSSFNFGNLNKNYFYVFLKDVTGKMLKVNMNNGGCNHFGKYSDLHLFMMPLSAMTSSGPTGFNWRQVKSVTIRFETDTVTADKSGAIFLDYLFVSIASDLASASAKLVNRNSVNKDAQGYLVFRKSMSEEGNARLEKTFSQQSNAEGRLLITYNSVNNSNSRVAIREAKVNFSNSCLQVNNIQKTINSNSRVVFRHSVTNTSEGFLLKRFVKTNEANAYIIAHKHEWIKSTARLYIRGTFDESLGGITGVRGDAPVVPIVADEKLIPNKQRTVVQKNYANGSIQI